MGHERAMNGFSTLLLGTESLAGQLYNWDFSVFDLNKASNGRPLYSITLALLKDQGLLDGWRLDPDTVQRYFRLVESMYKANPYHNNIHAADVTQTAGVIMASLNQHLSSQTLDNSSSGSPVTGGACGCCFSLNHGNGPSTSSSNSNTSSSVNNSTGGSGCGARGQGLSQLERFAVILASAVHDLAHPGVNNAFLVRTRAPTAVTYNDRSVNENMHASLAFQLALDTPGLNIFENFTQEEYELVRKLVLEMVLSTDMDVHFTLLKRFQDQLGLLPDVREWATPELRSLLFQMLVHLADLANPSRPWHLALKWAEQVVTEFLGQGEQEAAAGIPISPPCDKSKVCMPAAQLFFIERFMAPTLDAFSSSAPSFHTLASAWLADTQAKWSAFQSAGVTFPHQDYPQLPPGQAQLTTTLPGLCCCDKHAAAAHAAAPAAPHHQQQQHCKPGSEQQQGQQQQQAAAAVAAQGAA